MTMPSLIWGSPQWLTGALLLLGVAAVTILWSYYRAGTKPAVKIAAATLKALGFTALAISLLDPLLTGTRPLRGANAFVILADNSESLQIRDDNATRTRGEWLRDVLRQEAPWRTRLGQDFDVRGYVFDTHLRGVDGFDALTFDGTGTSLTESLRALSKRFRGLPLAGVLLFTDGNRTDLGDVDWSGPPIYPVVPPSGGVAKDVGVSQISISQTNFESAPAVIRADVAAVGYQGKPVVAIVADETGKPVERQQMLATGDGKPLSFRFQFRPERKGVNFYQVHAFAASDEQKPEQTATAVTDATATASEQTLANNNRLVVIDQGGGPYRVLYVSGRPNWEFKFLRRALQEDDQLELSSLVRIALRQPKFDFRSQRTQSTSPLFDGFDHPDAETAERSDETVWVGLGKKLDGVEQKPHFPKTADELYRYDAIVLDDLEASIFTTDQLTLLRNFVSQRGGGLLMLGGPNSFMSGKYDRTPVGELLPVYLNRAATGQMDEEYRLVLTREGWLQPWVRMRKTEDEERQRLDAMTPFQTLSRVGEIKPGAVVLAEVKDSAGTTAPALVVQQFGKGHVGALLIGDLWRWGMHRENSAESDLDRSWRQTIRWLVGDVPARVDVSLRTKPDSSTSAVELAVRVRDAEYRPLDNAKVTFKVTPPAGESITIDAEPDARDTGMYSTTYVTKQQGPYRVLATATSPDGSAVGTREGGWAAQPAADEFARLEPDREFLKTIASRTHGELVDGDNLASFVAGLSSKSAPITEPWTSPLWHNPLYFLIAITCLAAEWGLRRVNGLA
jgi:uncharacterized membrane protein